MCTLIVLRRGEPRAELIVALNRDEQYARPAAPPARHGAAIYGVDLLRGGTWFGVRTSGLMVALTNRRGEALSVPGPSRGDLVVRALNQGDVGGVTTWLNGLDARAYAGFNLVFGDARQLHLAVGGFGRRRVRTRPLHGELTLVLNDVRVGGTSGWKRRALRGWLAPAVHGSWPDLRSLLQQVLACHARAPATALTEPGALPREVELALSAVCVHTERYGTRSSAIVRVNSEGLCEYHHAEGPPCQENFQPVWMRA